MARIKSPAVTYVTGLAVGSRRAQATALDGMARKLSGGQMGAGTFPWGKLTVAAAGVLRGWLQETYAPATANRYLSALKGACKEAWRDGSMVAESWHRINDLKPVRGSSEPRGRMLDLIEIEALLMAATESKNSMRDVALLTVALETGLRLSELAALQVKDCSKESVKVRKGKGNKYRECPLNLSGHYLYDWIDVMPETSGSVWGLTNWGIAHVVRRLSKAARIKPVTSHDLRRTFASLVISVSDLAVASDLMGHSNVQTTKLYDRRPSEARVAAVRALAGSLAGPFARALPHSG
jgi:integrase